jgi:hypothetical protein
MLALAEDLANMSDGKFMETYQVPKFTAAEKIGSLKSLCNLRPVSNESTAAIGALLDWFEVIFQCRPNTQTNLPKQ